MVKKISLREVGPVVLAYGFSLLLVVAAVGVTLVINLAIKSIASPLFLLAIVLVAWRYGMRKGIFATVLSGLAINYFFVSPPNQVSGQWDDILRLLVFVAEGYALCWLITWRKTASEELAASRLQLQALASRQESLREDGRKRIAREIHDELGQALTGMKMETHFIRRHFEEHDKEAPSRDLMKKVDDLSNSIDVTISTVRRLATDLRPPILDDLGLVAAIEWQAHDFQRRTGITCVMSSNVESIDLDADYTTAIFRIFQETLTNIIRHAEASTITVNLKRLNRKLILKVEDDGKGISPEELANGSSLGILGMRERARLIGGELQGFNRSRNRTIGLLTR